MAGKESAGILLYRRVDARLEVFLVHPGGPFFVKKDAGAWSLPKGELDAGESPLAAATREFAEETGQTLDACRAGAPWALGDVTQKGGKVVHAFAAEGDWPAGAVLASTTFTIEWPPRSGEQQAFPEVDRGGFFDLEAAREKINPAQAALLDRLAEQVDPAAPVFKVVRPEEWDGATYAPSPHDRRDGFVHLSSRQYVERTRKRFFAGVSGLRLLAIDPARVPAGALRWEPTSENVKFPHLYGSLTLDMVISDEPID